MQTTHSYNEQQKVIFACAKESILFLSYCLYQCLKVLPVSSSGLALISLFALSEFLFFWGGVADTV